MVGLSHVGDTLSQSCQECMIVPCCCNLAVLVVGRIEIACHFTVSPSICLLFRWRFIVRIMPNVVPGDIAPLGDPGDAVVLMGLHLLPLIWALLICRLS